MPRRRDRRRRLSLLLAGAAVASCAACSSAGASSTPSSASTSVPSPAATAEAGPGAAPQAPDARQLTDQAAFVPQRLVLPSGRTAPVLPSGLGTDGTLSIPPDPAQVGWWTGGARPGDPYGTVVVAGHIDSRRFGIGVLAEIASARPGEVVRLVAGQQSRRYRIVSVRQVPKARLSTGTDTFEQTGPGRLALITCGGRFDRRTHSYADNVVVLATPA